MRLSLGRGPMIDWMRYAAGVSPATTATTRPMSLRSSREGSIRHRALTESQSSMSVMPTREVGSTSPTHRGRWGYRVYMSAADAMFAPRAGVPDWSPVVSDGRSVPEVAAAVSVDRIVVAALDLAIDEVAEVFLVREALDFVTYRRARNAVELSEAGHGAVDAALAEVVADGERFDQTCVAGRWALWQEGLRKVDATWQLDPTFVTATVWSFARQAVELMGHAPTTGGLYTDSPAGLLHAVAPDGEEAWSRDAPGVVVQRPLLMRLTSRECCGNFEFGKHLYDLDDLLLPRGLAARAAAVQTWMSAILLADLEASLTSAPSPVAGPEERHRCQVVYEDLMVQLNGCLNPAVEFIGDFRL